VPELDVGASSGGGGSTDEYEADQQQPGAGALKNSQRLRVPSHPAGGFSVSQCPVARLIGTLTAIVVTSDAASAPTAAQDQGRVAPLLAKLIVNASVSVMPMGMTRPKVLNSPCSTVTRSGCGSRRKTGWTKA
jgi:hypothetical protein